jgi:[acyl-carrier-protein] S-malonyltransferase
VVISGDWRAVELAAAALKARGAKRVMPLPVSAPFHSPHMKSAAVRLADALAPVTVAAPRVPLVCNVDGGACTDPSQIKSRLVEQVAAPVRWEACLREMAEQGVRHFVEVGPGKILSGIAKRVIPSARLSRCGRKEEVADLAAEFPPGVPSPKVQAWA